jgi:hypothetical protein
MCLRRFRVTVNRPRIACRYCGIRSGALRRSVGPISRKSRGSYDTSNDPSAARRLSGLERQLEESPRNGKLRAARVPPVHPVRLVPPRRNVSGSSARYFKRTRRDATPRKARPPRSPPSGGPL